MIPEDAQSIIAQVYGAIWKHDIELLYRLASEVEEGVIVEVGTFKGKSTVTMALGVRSVGRTTPIYAVDPHDPIPVFYRGEDEYGWTDRNDFLRTVVDLGLSQIIRPVDVPSSWVRIPNIELLFIDGEHTYEAVLRDWTIFKPMLMKKAKVAFHDAEDPTAGPYRLIQKLLESGDWTISDKGGMTIVVTRTSHLGLMKLGHLTWTDETHPRKA